MPTRETHEKKHKPDPDPAAGELERPSVRRRLRAKESRREDILQAALTLFARQGFEATRLDDVADIAEISKGTIYLYFKNKEELFEGVVKRRITPVIKEAEAQFLADDVSSEDALRMGLKVIYGRLVGADLRQIFRLMVAEGPRFPHLTEIYYDSVIRRGRMVLSAVIERGVARGEFRDVGLSAYPQLIMGPAMMGAIWTILFDKIDPIDLEELCERQTDLLLNGLRAETKKSLKRPAAKRKRRR